MISKEPIMHRDLPEVYLASPRLKPERSAPTSNRTSTPLLQQIGFGILLMTASAAAAAFVISGAPAKLLRLEAAFYGDASAEFREAPAFLARSTLMALHDANTTGDYGVFRALAAPGFQALNSSEALAQIFAGLRREQVDLSVAAVASPNWETSSAIAEDGLYRLRGALETGRHAVRFALAYATVDEQWRLIEISVAAEPVTQRGAAAAVVIEPQLVNRELTFRSY